ncbi:hypothetical protein BSKO_08058 [Bryopsis sp. KO-2023]|nr:hypothetical protein BSKO_08058 [Bryopsis sp. KO-2023]
MSNIQTHASCVRLVAPPRPSVIKRARVVCRADFREAGTAKPLNCYNDLTTADTFNTCYLHFDELKADEIVQCVSVAKKVVDEAQSADVCNAEVCTKKEHADWFASYFSHMFGLE